MASLDQMEGDGVELVVSIALGLLLYLAYLAYKSGRSLADELRSIAASFTGAPPGSTPGFGPVASQNYCPPGAQVCTGISSGLPADNTLSYYEQQMASYYGSNSDAVAQVLES